MKGESGLGKLIIATFAIGMVILASQAINAGYIDASPYNTESFSFGVPENKSWISFQDPQNPNTNIEYVNNNLSITMDNQDEGNFSIYRGSRFTNASRVDNTISSIEISASREGKEDEARAFVIILTSDDFSRFGIQDQHQYEITREGDNEIQTDIKAKEIKLNVKLNNTKNDKSYTIDEVLLKGTIARDSNALIDQLLGRGIEIFLVILALIALFSLAAGS